MLIKLLPFLRGQRYTRMCEVMLVRHIGQCASRSAQRVQTQRCPHGIRAFVPAPSMHTAHKSSATCAAPVLSRPRADAPPPVACCSTCAIICASRRICCSFCARYARSCSCIICCVAATSFASRSLSISALIYNQANTEINQLRALPIVQRCTHLCHYF